MIRAAGVILGNAIARNISFLAPEALIIGGALSAVDAFIAGVRQSLHERCLHVIMEHIVIEESQSGTTAALWGARRCYSRHHLPPTLGAISMSYPV